MRYNKRKFKFHGVGLATARSYGFKIDFVRNLISGSAAWFFVIIRKFIFTPVSEIKIHEKKFLDPKKNSFSKVDFHKLALAQFLAPKFRFETFSRFLGDVWSSIDLMSEN